VRAASGSGDEWRFTGEQWDHAAELYFLRARYYDPSVGRFVSADPFPGYAQQPQTQHRYVYVMNDPVNRVDPSGLLPCFAPTDCELFARKVERIVKKHPNKWDAIDALYDEFSADRTELYLSPEILGAKYKRPHECYGFKHDFYNNSHHYIAYLWAAHHFSPIVAHTYNLLTEVFYSPLYQGYGFPPPVVVKQPIFPGYPPEVHVDPTRVDWDVINDSGRDFWVASPIGIEHGAALMRKGQSITDLPYWIRHDVCDRLVCREDDCCY
jgi:RHS repeat-associated protein